jgi:bacillolysin/thermolysin
MAGDQAVSIFSQLHPDISLDPTPRVSQDDVTASVSRLANGEKPAGDPELVILPLDSNQYALAYRVRVNTPTDRIIYFVDANSGEVRWQYSEVERQSAVGSGTGVFGDKEKVSASAFGGMFVAEDLLRPPSIATFDLKGNVSRVLGFLDGVTSLGAADLASSTNNTWIDGVDVDAHVYAGFTYDYYFKRFGRHGLTTMTFPSPC